MPLFTFHCAACDLEQEELMKFRELETAEVIAREPCPAGNAGCRLFWKGAELVQVRDFSKGKYGMQAIMGDGTKKRVSNVASAKKRSDS